MDIDIPREVVIKKEDAIFRMDENGVWHNQHGKFEHPRIIKHFNRSIRKDNNGFFVYQSNGRIEEKVYFSYVETAIFAIDVRESKEMKVILNTGKTVVLNPRHLLLKNDRLYLKTAEYLVKFSSKAMIKLSRYMVEEEGKLFFKNGKEAYLLE